MEEDSLLESAKSVNKLDEYLEWEQLCDESLEVLQEKCRSKRQRTSTGAVYSLMAQILQLKKVRNDLSQRFTPMSSGQSDLKEFLWLEMETAFNKRVLTGAVINSSYKDPRKFLEDAKDTVLDQVRSNLEKHRFLKVNTVFNGEFDANDKTAVQSISTKNQLLTSDLQKWYDECVVEVTLAKLEEFQERGSGWALSRILYLLVNVNKCNPMHAGCWVEIPQKIELKKAVINVRSTDNACFAWSVIAALYPVKKNANRCALYPHYSTKLNLDGIEFPMTLSKIAKFERLNEVSINVYSQEENGDISIVHLTNYKKDRHINLLYLPDSEHVNTGHFAWIKNLSRLVGSQLSRCSHKKYICDRCLHYFYTEEKLFTHSGLCEEMNNNTTIALPKDDKWLFFRNYNRQERLPFVVYADLECVLEKEKIEITTKTHISQRHRAFAVGYYLCCTYDKTKSEYKFRRGEDCVSWFVKELNNLAHRVKEIRTTNVPMVKLTLDEECGFSNATDCHVCRKPFESEDQPVRDHCHLTGRYRGPAHSRCNLNYKDSYIIPVFFHNLSGYDAHFIIEDIANGFKGKVDLLPLTKETYISFTKNVTLNDKWENCIKLRFVDSFRFLNTSIEKLASYLDKNKLRIMRSEFLEVSEKDFDLLTRKGVFPYDYVDNVDKLYETQLPGRDVFHNSLTGCEIATDDYEHALKVWQCFRVKNLGEFSDLYLKTDVLLLADIFENFRDTFIESYRLDPAHYYTLPGYAWDVMLKYTNVKLELLTDIDMMLFVEKGVRGGLSQCSNRYAQANNKYEPSTYDSSKPSTYLMYFDVNNLYGWAMCEPLPYAEFQWVDDIENFVVTSVTPDSTIGYILEVDLTYPRKLHDRHADLPFCPIRDKQCKKLLATLNDKSHYVIHYRNLQQCLQYGLRLTKIHRILRFAQFPWLREYIELNTKFRTNASNEFEQNMYKLMNNAVFGKTMENVRNHVDVRLVTRWDGRYGAEDLIAKPNFQSRTIFSENLMAIQLRKLKIMLNKPIYMGMCILEISKTRLYDFHYDYMTSLYDEKCKIMYTDTDSLIYRIECDDVYEDMKRNIAKFDTSDYPENNPFNMPRENKKVLGLMKDENKGAIMTEFIGLRAKMYALKVSGKDDQKKLKGIKKGVVAREIKFDDYKQCLNTKEEQSRSQSSIRSLSHEVYTVSEKKLALSPYDDKRYIKSDSYDTLPWGHYEIP